jgi:uncharacterized protein (TIGR01777 family)
LSDKGKVLITGGTGLIGSLLSKKLGDEGYEVCYLSRSSRQIDGVSKVFQWDIDKGFIEEDALKDLKVLIHLAGENIGEKAWTPENRKRILNSRTESTQLLIRKLQESGNRPQKVLCASAIGYYGSSNSTVFTEDDAPGSGFAADVTRAWEHETDQFRSLGVPCTQVRIGIVLSTRGGALPQMMLPVKLFAGAPIGSGKQRMSWIHLEDLVDVFQFFVHTNYDGRVNAVAPEPLSNREFMKSLRAVMSKINIAPPVPAFALRLIMGERADLVLNDQAVSSKKLQEMGFKFRFKDLKLALSDLISRSI